MEPQPRKRSNHMQFPFGKLFGNIRFRKIGEFGLLSWEELNDRKDGVSQTPDDSLNQTLPWPLGLSRALKPLLPRVVHPDDMTPHFEARVLILAEVSPVANWRGSRRIS
jgi:hypothetical protein